MSVLLAVLQLQWLPVGGEAQERLTLEAALQRALSVHPSLQVADAVVERAEAARREVGASLLPAVSADASLTRFEEPMVVAPLHGFDPGRPPVFDRTLGQASLTLGYTAFDGGLRSARVERAGAHAAAARSAAAQQRHVVVAELVRRYAAVHARRSVSAAHASRVIALEQERARAQRLLDEGRAARVVVLRAEAALSAARADSVTASAQQLVAERELARMMGVAAADVQRAELLDVEAGGGVPELGAVQSAAVSWSPELQRMRAEVAAGRAGEAEARAQRWPRVLLGSRYVQYGSGAGDAGGEWQAGVQLSHALFTAGARPAAASRARAERMLAEAELAHAELRLADAVDRSHALLLAAQSRRSALAAAVAQMEEVARIERLALDSGAGVQADYLRAEADLMLARASLAEARLAELSARVDLARASGGIDEAWVAAHVEVAR
jgi:outer membrane protein